MIVCRPELVIRGRCADSGPGSPCGRLAFDLTGIIPRWRVCTRSSKMLIILSLVHPGFPIVAALVAPCLGGGTGHSKPVMPGLESAGAFAQSLAQWEFIIIGASVLVILGTSYYRPQRKLFRLSYLLFIPAWGCLAYSIYRGVRAQETYLAYTLLANSSSEGVIKALNHDLNSQIRWMWVGLVCLAIWLTVYLIWWALFMKLGCKGVKG